jgi:hypothetical protein
MRKVMMQGTTDYRQPLTDTQMAEIAGELRDDLRRLQSNLSGVPGSRLAEPERRARERSLILAALARMDAGTYGMCLGCRNQIPYARLAAIPVTQTCIDCVWRRDSSGDN